MEPLLGHDPRNLDITGVALYLLELQGLMKISEIPDSNWGHMHPKHVCYHYTNL